MGCSIQDAGFWAWGFHTHQKVHESQLLGYLILRFAVSTEFLLILELSLFRRLLISWHIVFQRGIRPL
jgi:hypothetical protein